MAGPTTFRPDEKPPTTAAAAWPVRLARRLFGTPLDAAPYNILIEATSLSACKNVPPSFGKYSAADSAISLAGVIGYPK